MFVKSLKLKNFRNYDLLDLEFDAETNIFYGDNAQGKTNILESIYLTGTTKSHRGTKDRDLIKFGEEEAHIETVVEKQGVPFKIDIHLKKNSPKGIAINKIPIKRASELFGIINIVFFSPEDLNIIKNGPSERRRFIDIELAQLDKVYLNDLSNYNRIVNQRNKLLKDIYLNPSLKDTLSIWDSQLVSYGSKIIERRIQFVNQLNEIINGIHKNLSGGKEDLRIVYEPDISIDEYEKTLSMNQEKDIRLKMTTVGPHRDDISFMVKKENDQKEIDIRKYGSQGQQRTAALSLKLSEIELVRKVTKDTPVLLLDDVLSELDSNRQNYLLNSIGDIQTIITCTGLDEFINNRFQINRVYKVTNGSVELKS